jgi:hypothetical protein
MLVQKTTRNKKITSNLFVTKLNWEETFEIMYVSIIYFFLFKYLF